MTMSERVAFLPETKLRLPTVPTEILDVTYVSVFSQEPISSVYPNNLVLPFTAGPLVYLPIKNTEYLCTGDDVKTVIEITLENKDDLIEFKAGDTIGILPQNCADEIEYLVKRLKLENVTNRRYALSLKNVNGTKKSAIPVHLPAEGILNKVLSSCVDVRSILKKTFICALSKYTNDPIEQRNLEELSSKEGSQIYNENVLNTRMNIIDLLKQYPSCNPPITLLLQHLPRLMPRPYSICNSLDRNENVIKFCFSVNENTKGIATGWMETMASKLTLKTDVESLATKLESIHLSSKENEVYKIPIYLRKSNSFCLPSDNTKPIIMIALGTGVAPFIGFLSERQSLMNLNENLYFGESVLYFGCRFRDKDFIYKKNIEQFISDGVLNKLRVSHSRETEIKAKYVQDNMIQDAEYLVKLIEKEDAVVYACGDINKITSEINGALEKCFCEVKNIQPKEAIEIVSDLKKNNKLILDVWS